MLQLRSGLSAIRSYFSRPSIQTKYDPNTPVALYFEPSGRVRPITLKSMNGWSGAEYNALNNSITNRGNAVASEQGFAYLSEVNVWIRRCIEIRAQSIARLDWFVEDKLTGDRVPDHPLTIAIDRARHYMLRYERSMDIWGEVYTKPLKNRYGFYSDVWWLNNLSVNFNIVNGRIDQFYFVPLHGGKPFVWQTDEVSYIFNENAFDDLHGSSRILSIIHEANVHEEIARSAQAHFANDARPGIMFLPESDMGVPQSQEFINYWKANFQGSLNTNKPVLLPSVIKSVQVLERAALKDDVEFRGTIRREICAAFGVPLSVAGAWDDANYQSAPEQRKSLYEETIIPEADGIAKDMTMYLLPFFESNPRYRVWYDAKKLLALAEDKQAKAAALNSQLVSGGITLNEYREAMDTEAIPSGNVFYVPSGVIVTPVDKVGSMPPPAPPGGGFGGFASAPEPSTPQAPPPTEETAKAAGSMAICLSLKNNVDLIALQKRLKELLPDPLIQWSDPAGFHVTLVYVPSFDETQTQPLVNYARSYMPSEMSLNVGSLASFDKVGEHALHFRIPRNSDLMGCQEELYAACESLGLQMSAYSDPSQFKPHITMGYAPHRIPITRFQSNLRVSPDGLEVSVESEGKYTVVHRSDLTPNEPDLPIEDAIEPEKIKGLPGSTEEIEAIEAPPPAPLGSQFDGINQGGDEPDLPESIVAKTYDPLLEELDAYEKFTLNRWGKPLRAFTFNVIDEERRAQLVESVARCKTKSDVKHLFEGWRVELKAKDDDPDIVTPEQAQEWWADYDRLSKTLGNDWLRDYMREVWRKLESRLSRDISVNDVSELLDTFHPELIEKWTGTVEEPGVIAKLFMAGMGAGQAALTRKRVNLNPAKADIGIDWSLVPSDAIGAVEQYVGRLIRDIDGTTLKDVQTIIAQWLESGEPISDLARQLSPIFNDPDRARLIAQTESNNAYTQGAIQRWQDAGVEKVRWVTVRDSHVCPVCEELAGDVSTIAAGFGGQGWIPPQHPGCILPGNLVQLPGELLAATKSLYIGRCVELTLANGRKLTVTENHPILTTEGWIQAQFLNKSHKVISTLDAERVFLSVEPDDHNVPTSIEQVFDTFMKSSNVITATMPTAPENFYGDGRSIHGNIDVVYSNRLLLGHIQTAFTQPVSKCSLCGRDMTTEGFNSFRTQFSLLDSSDTPLTSGMSFIEHGGGGFGRGPLPSREHGFRDAARRDASSNQALTQSPSIDTDLKTEGLLSFPRKIADNESIEINLSDGLKSGVNAILFKNGLDTASINSQLAGEFCDRFASSITIENISDIQFFAYNGHVYDLQVDPYELYTCNGVVVKNCRCYLKPVL
jgi:SPP1 gp7 family putative phage head morphogenesis protein